MNYIQLMAMAQPNPLAIYEETYLVGEKIIPKLDGKYTVYSILPMYSKDTDNVVSAANLAGYEAINDCQVIWLAADDVAMQITQQRNMKAVQSAHARAKLLGQA